jgi:hypothetical protein
MMSIHYHSLTKFIKKIFTPSKHSLSLAFFCDVSFCSHGLDILVEMATVLYY